MHVSDPYGASLVHMAVVCAVLIPPLLRDIDSMLSRYRKTKPQTKDKEGKSKKSLEKFASGIHIRLVTRHLQLSVQVATTPRRSAPFHLM